MLKNEVRITHLRAEKTLSLWSITGHLPSPLHANGNNGQRCFENKRHVHTDKAPDLYVMTTFTLGMSCNDYSESTEEADTPGHQSVTKTKSN